MARHDDIARTRTPAHRTQHIYMFELSDGRGACNLSPKTYCVRSCVMNNDTQLEIEDIDGSNFDEFTNDRFGWRLKEEMKCVVRKKTANPLTMTIINFAVRLITETRVRKTARLSEFLKEKQHTKCPFRNSCWKCNFWHSDNARFLSYSISHSITRYFVFFFANGKNKRFLYVWLGYTTFE